MKRYRMYRGKNREHPEGEMVLYADAEACLREREEALQHCLMCVGPSECETCQQLLSNVITKQEIEFAKEATNASK